MSEAASGVAILESGLRSVGGDANYDSITKARIECSQHQLEVTDAVRKEPESAKNTNQHCPHTKSNQAVTDPFLMIVSPITHRKELRSLLATS